MFGLPVILSSSFTKMVHDTFISYINMHWLKFNILVVQTTLLNLPTIQNLSDIVYRPDIVYTV